MVNCGGKGIITLRQGDFSKIFEIIENVIDRLINFWKSLVKKSIKRRQE
jgi:hypothetical protein